MKRIEKWIDVDIKELKNNGYLDKLLVLMKIDNVIEKWKKENDIVERVEVKDIRTKLVDNEKIIEVLVNYEEQN